MPCEVPLCPCARNPEFAADLAGLTACEVESGGTTINFARDYSVGISAIFPRFNLCQIGYGDNVVNINVSTEEALLCRQMVLDSAANRGVTCQPF